MTYNIFRKSGIPVLVYLQSDATSPWPCSLIFKHSMTRNQATISLQTSIPIRGFDDEQAFILQYDADNLVPGTISLGPATIPLPQARLNEIARHGRPQIRTLSLTVKESCPLWCPPSPGSIEPKPGFEPLFYQLTNLACATHIHILFDYNWLHRNNHAPFQRLIDQPEQLTGFPVGEYYARIRRRADWTVFGSLKRAVDEAPPSYTDASCKRPRHASNTPSPSSPPLKHVLLSPAHIHTSPTEKASTVSILSPIQPSSPTAHAPELQDAVNMAMSTLLPGMLEAILPDILPRLFRTPAYSFSPSPSLSSTISTPPPPLSSLGTLLSSEVSAHIEGQLQSIYSQTLSHASYLRNTADAEFFEALDDHRIDMLMVKEDGVRELDCALVEKLEELREQTEDVLEDAEGRVGEHAWKVYDNVREKLDEEGLQAKAKSAREREELKREKKWLGWEREVLERDRRRFEEEKSGGEQDSESKRRDRALTAPL